MTPLTETTRTALRSVAFLVGVAVAFVLALGLGRVVGPLDTEPVAHGDSSSGGHSDAEEGGSAEGPTDAEAQQPDGGEADHAVADATALTARADGFTLALADRVVPSGRTRLAFQVLTSSGRPLVDYTEAHERDLHLIVVRRDLTGFRHVHPRLDPGTGTWSTTLRLDPGVWRVIADFTPDGWEGLTLADDLSVAGGYRPADLPADSRSDTVRTSRGDYAVALEGDTAPGAATYLTTRIELDGRPVDDLQPYLGAYGHLVALRAGDLGYLHVHPEPGGPGPGIDFATAFPTPGTYRLFLDFRHGGRVHTAEFTVVSSGTPGAPEHEEEDEDHGH